MGECSGSRTLQETGEASRSDDGFAERAGGRRGQRVREAACRGALCGSLCGAGFGGVLVEACCGCASPGARSASQHRGEGQVRAARL